ncbi:MAG TPA: signal peptidase I [Acidobacteriota bacterium]|nr:signal peptidase I [Acidobacteriota bacterium]
MSDWPKNEERENPDSRQDAGLEETRPAQEASAGDGASGQQAELPGSLQSENAELAPAPETHSPSAALKELRSWMRDIFFAALAAILIVIFVVQPVKVEGTSMEPRLEDQERIFVNKFVYHFSDIDRGDIVVFWYPRDPAKSFIKRVVALPGETVEIRSGVVYIDGQRLSEPYVPPSFFDYTSYPPETVPQDHFFVLGDHRNSSNDSRNWGPVPRDNVFGKAVFRYWPVSRLGLIE